MSEVRISTIGELKSALRRKCKVYCWVNFWGNDGEYVEVAKNKLLIAIGADVAFHRDGRHPSTEFYATIREDGDIYVDGDPRR